MPFNKNKKRAGQWLVYKLMAILALSVTGSFHVMAQSSISGCTAEFESDTLTLGNNVIGRKYLYKNGNLLTLSVTDKKDHHDWIMAGMLPSFSIPSLTTGASHPVLMKRMIKESGQMASHLEAELIVSYGELQLKRVFRIYPGCPAIACDFYLKGNATGWEQQVVQANDIKNLESVKAAREGETSAIITDRMALPGLHWKVKTVEFFDATDQNNTLVQEYRRTAYRQELRLRGNIAFMEELASGKGLFWLKEAPVPNVQLNYPGADFAIKTGDFKSIGLGIAAADISSDGWIRGYSIVTGVFTGGEDGGALALRSYQQGIRPHGGISENMILLNTWGDRGQDKNINEEFILKEIELGAKLGITHLQLDDGWQTGRSANSAYQGGTFNNIWHKPGYWLPDPAKFPHAFSNIIALAASKNIIISTWFNPSVDSSFKYWENDAGVLIDQYKKYGIYTWKIDGVRIADKEADVNFRKMLDTVVARTDGKAIFNLDVTAGRRFGYNYFYEYGNLFLENRYTDWANYYPHFTLRNLWMLSNYIPPQRLQVEFLNKWRNNEKYAADDVLRPASYSFEYLFAVTMAAQPLAWMEARNLPAQAFELTALIKTYKKYWEQWHKGMIFPVGNEPSGYSWTGFQSIDSGSEEEGFILVFREANPDSKAAIALKNVLPGKYTFSLIAGSGKSFKATINKNRQVDFVLKDKQRFAFYSYRKYP